MRPPKPENVRTQLLFETAEIAAKHLARDVSSKATNDMKRQLMELRVERKRKSRAQIQHF